MNEQRPIDPLRPMPSALQRMRTSPLPETAPEPLPAPTRKPLPAPRRNRGESQDYVETENLDNYIKMSVKTGQPYLEAMRGVHREDRQAAKRLWEMHQEPKGIGEALQKGLGGNYKIGQWEVPIIPKGFLDGVGEVASAFGEAILIDAPKFLANTTFTLDPSEGAIAQALGNIDLYRKAWLYESSLDDSPEMMQARDLLAQAEQASKDPDEIESLKRRLIVATEQHKPFMALIDQLVEQEIAWVYDRQAFLNKVANNPVEIASDIASAVALLSTGGASVLPKQAALLKRIAKYSEYADPINLPRAATSAIDEGVQRGLRGRDANMTNKPDSFRYGREGGQDLTDEMRPDEGAIKFGQGVEDTPDYARNQQQRFQTLEMARAEREGGVGQRAQQRTQGTMNAIEESKRRMTESIQNQADPFDALASGKATLSGYQERQWVDKIDFKQRFAAINENFQRLIPQSHNWRKNLDEALDELQPTQVVPRDLQRAKKVLDDILNPPDAPAIDTENLSLADIDEIRTEFRRLMKLSFDNNEISQIGSGSPSGKIYAAISEDFYDAIDASVDASNGKLPASLKADVKEAKRLYKEVIDLEKTPAGEFLLKKAHQDNPDKLITNLMKGQLSTDEIPNLYKMVGDTAALDVQAAVLWQLFESSGSQANRGAGQLSKDIRAMLRTDPNRLVALMGGGNRGRDLAREIVELAEFSKRMEPQSRIFRGSPTGKINLLVQQTAAGALVGSALEVGRVFYYSDMPAAIAFAAGLAGTALLQMGYDAILHSEAGRKRLLDGLEMPNNLRKTFDLLLQAQARKYTKPVEFAKSMTEGVQDEQQTFEQRYMQRGRGDYAR